MNERSYIVTGGAGFIGSNVAAELVRREAGARVVVVDNFSTGSCANIVEAFGRRGLGPFGGEVIAESAGDVDWARAISRLSPAAVYHLGAITDTTVTDEKRMIEENLGGFRAGDERSMLAACAGRNVPLVYASSAATYGTPPQAGRREAFPEQAAGRPNNVYGFSKWMMEQEHARWMRVHPRAHMVGLRYFNVFGPGEARKGKMASMPYQLTMKMLSGERPRLFTDGSQSRDQVSVDDVVDGTIAAAGLDGRRVTSGVYNLGSGVATSFNECVEAIRRALDLPASRVPTEYFEMPAAVRAFYQDFTQADMRGAVAGLSWSPSRRPAEAIESYARWLAKRDASARG